MNTKLIKKQNDKTQNERFLRILTDCSVFFIFLLFNSWATAQDAELPTIQLPSYPEDTQVERTAQPAKNELPPYYAVPIETASFNGIIPGQTQTVQLRKDFGEPINIQKNGGGQGIDIEEYKPEGFKAVAFHVMDKTVMAVVAELEESVNARDLAAGLGMSHIQSVFITDQKGVIKGEIYPEIGVAFAYDPNKPLGNVADMAKNPTEVPMNALQILFQPVGPDPFLLRAETWVDIDPKRAYRDILQALKMDPKNKKALAYQKIITDVAPKLKDATLEELSPEAPNAEEDAEEKQVAQNSSAEEKSKSEPETQELPEIPDADVALSLPETDPLPELELSETSQISKESENVADEISLTELTPPSLDSMTEAEETNIETVSDLPETAPELPMVAPNTSDASDSLPEMPESAQDSTDEKTARKEMKNNAPNQGSLRILPNKDKEKTTLELPMELDMALDLLEKSSDNEKESETRSLELSFENELFENVEFLARSERIPQALELLDEMRKKFLDNPFVSFRINIVEGDILMILPEPQVQQAFRCHRRAAEQGEKLLEDGKVIRGRRYPLTASEKLAIQELLLDAWLGVASDLAFGEWERKESNCLKWLMKAKSLIDELVPATKKELTPEMITLRYRTAYRMLSIAIPLGENIDFTEYANYLISASQERLRIAETPLQYFDVCAETALLLDDAGSISILRKEDVAAQRYLTRAIALMERVKEAKEKKKEALPTNETFLLAQLYYHMGQVQAWQANRLMAERPENIDTANQKRLQLHEQAIVWYEKSIPLLMTVIRSKEWRDLLQLSRIVNGMSVSYMETSDAKRALALLKTGIFCLEQHVATHSEDKFQLATPYRNIIRVLTYQGDREEREKYQRKLDALKQ